MSLRKAKKLLEQKKAMEANLQQLQEAQQEQQAASQTKASMFSLLDDGDSDNEEQIEKEIKHTQKQQKTKGDNEQKKKKNKKKKKKKANDEEPKKEQEEEDYQKIFKEVGLEYKQEKDAEQQQKVIDNQLWESILSINESKFNYEKQLRKHFNSVTGFIQEKNDDPQLNKKQQKMQKHLKKMMKKSVLSPGIKEYFPINEKFQMDRTQNQIRFMPTKKYDHFQVEYEAVRNTNDINALFMFSQTHPQHVDSLYFVGEFLRLQGNYRDADNLIQRVIYIYEAAAGYDVLQFIKNDVVKKQIIYDIYSTSLFMALFKFMDILGKKGCFRAALQYNKFLLKININDPTACLLCIDYNSISSKSYNYLLNFVKNYSQYCGQPDTTLYLMPNFIYSTALAKFEIQNQKNIKQLLVEENNMDKLINFTDQHWNNALKLPFKNKQAFFDKQSAQTLLLRAILVYPNLIMQIAEKNEYSKQFMNHSSFVKNQQKPFKQLLKHQFWEVIPSSYSYYFLKLESVNDSNGLDKVLEIYVERSKILWKSRQVMLWVKAALGFVLNKIDEGTFSYQQFLQNLCLQDEEGLLIPFNLKKYQKISKSNFSDRVDQIDLANIQDQQPQHIPQNQNRMNLEGNAFSLFLNSLLPWVNLPGGQNRQEQFDPDMPDIQDD